MKFFKMRSIEEQNKIDEIKRKEILEYGICCPSCGCFTEYDPAIPLYGIKVYKGYNRRYRRTSILHIWEPKRMFEIAKYECARCGISWVSKPYPTDCTDVYRGELHE